MSRCARVSIPLVFLIASSLLGGCLDAGEPDPSGLLKGPGGPHKGTAVVTGTVFTADLEPIAQASVRLLLDGGPVTEALTDPTGSYELLDLAPGEYRLEVAAACCKKDVHVVEVAADDVAQVDLRLEPYSSDDNQVPRVEHHEWRGFLACTFRWPTGGVSPVPGFNVCGAVELAAPNSTGDDFLRRWEIGPGLETVVGAMQWQAPGAALGDELSLYLEVSGRPLEPPLYVAEQGRSPIEFRSDAGDVIERYEEEVDGENIHQYDFNNVEESLELMYRVFAGGDLNVVYQQRFTLYWDLHYWEPAPEGATALPDL